MKELDERLKDNQAQYLKKTAVDYLMESILSQIPFDKPSVIYTNYGDFVNLTYILQDDDNKHDILASLENLFPTTMKERKRNRESCFLIHKFSKMYNYFHIEISIMEKVRF